MPKILIYALASFSPHLWILHFTPHAINHQLVISYSLSSWRWKMEKVCRLAEFPPRRFKFGEADNFRCTTREKRMTVHSTFLVFFIIFNFQPISFFPPVIQPCMPHISHGIVIFFEGKNLFFDHAMYRREWVRKHL